MNGVVQSQVQTQTARAASKMGAACLELNFPDGIPMAGYSILGKVGRAGPLPLCVRAFYLEDKDGHRAVVCVADLMSASYFVYREISRRLMASPLAIPPSQFIFSGTHTHTAPGHYFGNSLYDGNASKSLFKQFDATVADLIVETSMRAIEHAVATARPARVSVDTTSLWGVSNSRSLAPFLSNKEAASWNAPGSPGDTTLELPPASRAVDPRVVVLTGVDLEGRLIGVLSSFGCHNTATGHQHSFYHPDWTGYACRSAAASLTTSGEAPIVAVALSGAADVSPIPFDARGKLTKEVPQGEALAERVGARVAEAIVSTASTPGHLEPLSLSTFHDPWWPETDFGDERSRFHSERDLPPLAEWTVGAPTLGGAEDGRSFFHHLIPEGRRGRSFHPQHPQYPKQEALGMLGRGIMKVMRMAPSPVHPLHALRVNGHLFATVPGEPTVMFCHRLERVLLGVPEIETASIVGYSGDYAGYFTTPEEFMCQHYEGASTLYGRFSCPHLEARYRRLLGVEES